MRRRKGFSGTDGWALRSLATAIALAFAAREAAAKVTITGLYTDKARYDPGAPVQISVVITNTNTADWMGTIILDFWRLSEKIGTKSQPVTVVASTTSPPQDISWTPPAVLPTPTSTTPVNLDFTGYLVRATVGAEVDYTAIDVSSDWRQYIRYGYLTRFQDGLSHADLDGFLNPLARNYHINVIQYYDWMWRHEHVIQRDLASAIVDPWVDWSEQKLSYKEIQYSIDQAHTMNVTSLPYFQIYIALDREGNGFDYETYSPPTSHDWRLFYKDPSSAIHDFHSSATMGTVTTDFCAFNPLNSGWQTQIERQAKDAVQTAHFDGIHYDQLDKPSGFNGWCDPVGNPIPLRTGFAPIIDDTAEILKSLTVAGGTPKAQTFNLVDGNIDYWHVNDVVWNSAVDFIYSEIWNNKTYINIHKFIRWAREESRGKPIVLAAYMNMDDAIPSFEEHSVRLADAAFFASGASHIEMGDGHQMLSVPYFRSVKKVMSAKLTRAMRDEYNFAVAYEKLLFSKDLFYGDRGLQWIDIQGKDISGDGTLSKIWFLTRRSADYEVIHLINLPNHEGWREAITSTLPSHANLKVKYWIGPDVKNVKGVYLASPDFDGGVSQSLTYSMGVDVRGSYVSFEVPKLEHWDMVYIDRQIEPTDHRYQAEAAIRYAPPPNPPASYPPVGTALADYSGTGYVSFSGSTPSLSTMSFWISVPSNSGYALQLRYMNQLSASNLDASVYIDGNYAGKFLLPAIGLGWARSELNVHLRPGPHQVVVMPPAAPIEFDYLQPCLPVNGIKGEYFSQDNLTHLAFTRTDHNIDFDWGTGSPAGPSEPGFFPADHFSVRWSGTVRPPVDGKYTFSTFADDGVNFYIGPIGSPPIISDWTEHPATKKSSPPTPLLGGTKYEIRLEYNDLAGPASLRLLWSATDPTSSAVILPEEVIPFDDLFPSPYEPDDDLKLEPAFLRGDADGNGIYDMTDAVLIFGHVHLANPVPCEDACDIDDDGVVEHADGLAFLAFWYTGSAVPPVCPYPYCGRDLTPDSLKCDQSPCQ